MNNLPDHLIVMILSRLNDSFELARCKCVSKTLNTLGRQIRSIHLYCSLERRTKMRSPEFASKLTPFKTIFHKLISDAQVPIESISLGMVEFSDHLLTGGHGWMTNIGPGLKSISISAFLFQLSGRKSNILELLSHNCPSLVELTLEKAILSVDGMHLMPFLSKLMLNCVRIHDESLNKLMECLPCLQVFNFIGNGVGTDTKIHHLNLKELKWTVTAPYIKFIKVFAPSLTKLELECHFLIRVSIHAPLLSYFHLTLEKAAEFNVEKFKTLKTLGLVSPDLHRILSTFPSSTTVQNLTLDSPKFRKLLESFNYSLANVSNVFPNVTSLTLGSEVCSEQMLYPLAPLAQMKDLKQITFYLVLDDIDKALSFILYVVGTCTHLSNIVLFIHRDVDLSVAISFVSRCTSQCPKVRLRWGIWKGGTKDCCISNCIGGAANAV